MATSHCRFVFIGFGVLQLLGGTGTPSCPSGAAPPDGVSPRWRLRGAGRRDRALRLSAAPRRAAHRAVDQPPSALVLPPPTDAVALRRTPRTTNIFDLANASLYTKGFNIGTLHVALLSDHHRGVGLRLMVLLWFLSTARTGKAMARDLV